MTNIKKIQINKIKVGKYQHRTEIENKEEIESLAESIKKEGLLQPIGVIQTESGYELMFGHRRLKATMLLNKKEIAADVYEGIDEVDASLKCIDENFHRKDWSPHDKDVAIYTSWKLGKNSNKYKYKSIYDMAKRSSIPQQTLYDIISASEEKEKIENVNNSVIQKATTYDLERTKSLSKHSNLRDKILELEQTKNDDNTQKLTALNLEKMSKTIKNAVDNGVNETLIKNAINLIAEDKRIEPEKFNKIIETIKLSPPDIQEKIVKKEISLDDAIVANKFETKKERETILTELTVLKTKQTQSTDRRLNRRLQQASDMKEGKIQKEFDMKPTTESVKELCNKEYSILRGEVFRILGGSFNLKNTQLDEDTKNHMRQCMKDIRDRINKELLSENIIEPEDIIIVSNR